jgi:hypothetical protein
MKLPLRIENVSYDSVRDSYSNYDVLDSNDDVVMGYSRCDNSQSFSYEDTEEVVKTINSFPEAIRLLKECLKYMYPTGTKNEVNEFLTKLEEDENN